MNRVGVFPRYTCQASCNLGFTASGDKWLDSHVMLQGAFLLVENTAPPPAPLSSHPLLALPPGILQTPILPTDHDHCRQCWRTTLSEEGNENPADWGSDSAQILPLSSLTTDFFPPGKEAKCIPTSMTVLQAHPHLTHWDQIAGVLQPLYTNLTLSGDTWRNRRPFCSGNNQLHAQSYLHHFPETITWPNWNYPLLVEKRFKENIISVEIFIASSSRWAKQQVPIGAT